MYPCTSRIDEVPEGVVSGVVGSLDGLYGTYNLAAPAGRYFLAASDTADNSDAPIPFKSAVATASMTVSISATIEIHGLGSDASPIIGMTGMIDV